MEADGADVLNIRVRSKVQVTEHRSTAMVGLATLNRNIFQPARFAAGWSKGTFRFEAVYPVFTVGGPKRALLALFGPRRVQGRSENANLAATQKPQMKLGPTQLDS